MKKQLLIFFIFLIQCFFVDATNSTIADSLQQKSALEDTLRISEVQITGLQPKTNLLSGSTGISFSLKEIKAMPNIIGDTDPFLTIKSLGGITQSGEGNSGIYVRGGNNDQNLILLNGTIIQNPTHVLGMFSIFNPDVIERMRLIKSGIPAEYGGRLSSVFEIGTTNNQLEKFRVDGAIGLISSRLAIQTPIGEKLSTYAAFRGSYLNQLVLPMISKLGVDSTITQNRYEFIDANWGMVYSPSSKTKISTHLYYGKDEIGITKTPKWDLSDNTTKWNNKTMAMQLNHVFNQQWSMNHHLGYSMFHITSDMMWGNTAFLFNSSSENASYKADFFSSAKHHQLKFGSEISYDRTLPHFVKADSLISIDLNNEYNTFQSIKASAYIRDEYTYNNLLINLGIRINAYRQIGPYTDYKLKPQKTYIAGKTVQSYQNIEPRLFIRYLIDSESSIKASATNHVQYLSQIPMLSIGLPFDLQIPASLYVKPQSSWHLSTGYFRNFENNMYETSIEAYYKSFSNQLEFTSGLIGTFTNEMLEKNLLYGKGHAYGLEVLLHKTRGRYTGWISYALSWNLRQFDQLNKGEPFFAKNDRRHDLSIANVYKLNNKWSFAAMFVLASGSRINLPLSWFIIDDKIVLEYGKYNAFTMPTYHRLDLSVTYQLNKKKNLNSDLTFSIYNVYNRANPFQVFFDTKSFYSATDNFNFSMGMSYLLPVVPSITWTFHLN